YKNDRTFLRYCFCKQPFKLADITENKSGDLLRLMITSSSPGILDNDKYFIQVEIEEYAKVCLTTQGYQRIFTMANKASQCMKVEVRNNGSFSFLPHPNVPHTLSNFLSINNIYLNRGHHLIWSDIITCGRKLSGEAFKFSKFHNIINIYLNNRLVIKENVLLEPLIRNIQAIGQLEGYSHQSTLLFINDKADMQIISSDCNEILSGIKEIAFGISKLPVNGLVFRILGHKGEQLFDLNNRIALVIEGIIFSKRFHNMVDEPTEQSNTR
ncbi:MAG: urease accessory protein UreD, partial [Ginsengibacter sp.]